MNELTKEDVLHVAHLARIELKDEEIEKYMQEKTTIVIMKLSQCTDEVHRCIHLHPEYNYH